MNKVQRGTLDVAYSSSCDNVVTDPYPSPPPPILCRRKLGDKASRGSKWKVLDAGKKYLSMPVHVGNVPEEVGEISLYIISPWVVCSLFVSFNRVFVCLCRITMNTNVSCDGSSVRATVYVERLHLSGACDHALADVCSSGGGRGATGVLSRVYSGLAYLLAKSLGPTRRMALCCRLYVVLLHMRTSWYLFLLLILAESSVVST